MLCPVISSFNKWRNADVLASLKARFAQRSGFQQGSAAKALLTRLVFAAART
jgi:hypothetical protein